MSTASAERAKAASFTRYGATGRSPGRWAALGQGGVCFFPPTPVRGAGCGLTVRSCRPLMQRHGQGHKRKGSTLRRVRTE